MARHFEASRDDQFTREIAFHIEKVTQDHIASGMTPKEARRQALLQFGGAEQVKQQLREVHVCATLEGLRANLRSAFRFACRAPSFALAIVFTLALGIGANSTVYSAIDAILLRPLPFPQGDELIRIHQRNVKERTTETSVATMRLEDWNRLNSSFRAISGYYIGDTTYLSGPLPEKVSVAFVAPRFLSVWGVTPALGRDFTMDEYSFTGPGAVLISERFWRSQLNADPSALGKPLHFGKSSFTVVGVMPATFLFPDRDVDLWQPSPINAPYAQNRSSTWFTVIGRLKSHVSLAKAQADMAAVQSQLAQQFPKSDRDLTVGLEPLKSVVLGNIQGSLWLLYGSVTLLLCDCLHQHCCIAHGAHVRARSGDRHSLLARRVAFGNRRPAPH